MTFTEIRIILFAQLLMIVMMGLLAKGAHAQVDPNSPLDGLISCELKLSENRFTGSILREHTFSVQDILLNPTVSFNIDLSKPSSFGQRELKIANIFHLKRPEIDERINLYVWERTLQNLTEQDLKPTSITGIQPLFSSPQDIAQVPFRSINIEISLMKIFSNLYEIRIQGLSKSFKPSGKYVIEIDKKFEDFKDDKYTLLGYLVGPEVQNKHKSLDDNGVRRILVKCSGMRKESREERDTRQELERIRREATAGRQ